MADANFGKPKDSWKPPEGYKSALGKARDAQKAKEAKDKKKKKVSAVAQEFVSVEDTASDSDGDMSERGFSIAALRPLPRIQRKIRLGPINAVNKFRGLEESQEYDPEVLKSLNSWAHAVNATAPKTKPKKVVDSKLDRTVNYIIGLQKINDEPNDSNTEVKPESQRPHVSTVMANNEPTIVIQSEKDMEKHAAAVMKIVASLPSDPKKLLKAARKIGSLELDEDEILVIMLLMLMPSSKVISLRPLKERTDPESLKPLVAELSKDLALSVLLVLLMVIRSMPSGTT